METALVLQVTLFLFALAFQLKAFRSGVLHPSIIYLCFHGLVFVVRPVVAYLFDFQSIYTRMGFSPTDWQSISTLLISDLGLFAFMVVCSATSWRCRGMPIMAATPLSHTIQDPVLRKSFFVTLSILGLPVAWSCMHFLMHPLSYEGSGDFGGTTVTHDAATGAMLQTNSSSYLLDLQFMGGPLSIAWALLNRFKLPSLIPLGLYFFIRMCDGHGRFSFILISAAAAFVLLVSHRKVWPSAKIMGVACVLMLAFSSLGNDRHLIKRSLGLMNDGEAQANRAVEQRGKRLEDNSVFGPDFANYEYLNYVTSNIPSRSGTYSYFLQYADLLVKPIPRVFWPGKPAGSWLDPVNLNSFGNFSALTVGLVGDGWISLGFAGVILTLSFCGIVCGLAYNWFNRRGSTSIFVVLNYCLFLSLLPQWFRDGSTTIVEFLGVHLTPVVLWAWIYNKMRKNGVVAGPTSLWRTKSRPAAHATMMPSYKRR